MKEPEGHFVKVNKKGIEIQILYGFRYMQNERATGFRRIGAPWVQCGEKGKASGKT